MGGCVFGCVVCTCEHVYSMRVSLCIHAYNICSQCMYMHIPCMFIGCHLLLLCMYVCVYVCMHVHTVAASMLGQSPWVSAVTLGTCTSCVHVVNLHGWRTQAEGIKCSYFTVEMYCMNLLQEIEDWILHPAPCRPACNGRYST